VKHAALAAAVVLYVLVWGQNWTWFAGALMLTAIWKDWKREATRQ
jgi:hypothetical protein